MDSSFHSVPFGMAYALIFCDTDRSSTLSGHLQPDSVEDMSVLNLPIHETINAYFNSLLSKMCIFPHFI